jgi:hypothetical protein
MNLTELIISKMLEFSDLRKTIYLDDHSRMQGRPEMRNTTQVIWETAP